MVTPGVQVFDFVTGQTALVTQTSGGNRALTADRRDVTKIGLTLEAVHGKRDLTFTANYVTSHIRNPIQTLPARPTRRHPGRLPGPLHPRRPKAC